jgi:acetyltransferase-like isoleucine patch superfamily enzyme
VFNGFTARLEARARIGDGAFLESFRRFQRWRSGSRIVLNGSGNVLEIGPSQISGLQVEVHGNNNRVRFGRGARLQNLRIHIAGDHCEILLGENIDLDGCLLWVMGQHSRIQIGADCAFGPTNIYASDSNSRVEIGADCMFASDVEIRCGDGHTLFDRATGEIMNLAQYILIEDHVWFATGAWALKDVTIGEGSVIGAKAVVTRDVPAHSLAVGIPAKVIRENIGWRKEPIHGLPKNWRERTINEFV